MSISGPYTDPHIWGENLGKNWAINAIDNAEKNEEKGLIANLDNLKDQPVYIFSGGEKDNMVPPSHQQAQKQYYENYGSNIKYVEINAGHVIPSIF